MKGSSSKKYDAVNVLAWAAVGALVGAFWTGIVLAILWWRGAFGG